MLRNSNYLRRWNIYGRSCEKNHFITHVTVDTIKKKCSTVGTNSHNKSFYVRHTSLIILEYVYSNRQMLFWLNICQRGLLSEPSGIKVSNGYLKYFHSFIQIVLS